MKGVALSYTLYSQIVPIVSKMVSKGTSGLPCEQRLRVRSMSLARGNAGYLVVEPPSVLKTSLRTLPGDSVTIYIIFVLQKKLSGQFLLMTPYKRCYFLLGWNQGKQLKSSLTVWPSGSACCYWLKFSQWCRLHGNWPHVEFWFDFVDYLFLLLTYLSHQKIAKRL